jgi:hypothetical protein
MICVQFSRQKNQFSRQKKSIFAPKNQFSRQKKINFRAKKINFRAKKINFRAKTNLLRERLWPQYMLRDFLSRVARWYFGIPKNTSFGIFLKA